MPNKENAKKQMRKDEKLAQHNKVINAEIKSLRVKLRKLIDAKNLSEATEVAKLVSKKFDKAVSKNIVKKNTAARLKSRLAKKVNALKTK
ncbi:30S ribosomal protein S20 [Candidatus Uhrbacteria bacterium RIFOXYB2_FULL_45_11]|uniref:Small ribosomal subunit protein bS20 n=1 Tax=Candidatus Uhrbacteria bacterium RIFOXYB2_FULL_45_11 TaxID=1802421 RepID=A0A1F7WBX0_9BACT|nr:MAG: 30S ribosomal protein S20 [Candidatus Uhrbacteria bacterium RIFOXYB2_FULL_45_11]